MELLLLLCFQLANPDWQLSSLQLGVSSKVKSSVQRSLRNKFVEQYPGFEPYIEEILPKKASLLAAKLCVFPSAPIDTSHTRKQQTDAIASVSPNHVTLYLADSRPLFYQHYDDPLVPHLCVVHAFPTALPSVGIDRGAIRFVLSGAALMAPGLTSAGGKLPDPENNPDEREFEAGEVVAIRAEGKNEVCMVGPLKVGTDEIKKKGKGVVMDEGHYLGDGLWKMAF